MTQNAYLAKTLGVKSRQSFQGGGKFATAKQIGKKEVRGTKNFSKNRLTSEIERGIIGINKDVHAIFIVSVNRLSTRRNTLMKRKSRMILLFAVALMFLLPGISAEAKTKPKLEAKKKTTAVGQKCQLKLNGVPGRAGVKWKTNNKRVVSIAKRKGNTVTFKAVKKGKAVVSAIYKKKKYRCRVTVKVGKKKKPTADRPVLNSSDVILYYLSEEYKDYITYYSGHTVSGCPAQGKK